MTLLFVTTAAGLSVIMSMALFIQRKTGLSGWIYAIWSFAFGAAGLSLAAGPLDGRPPGPRQYLVAFFAVASAFHLGLHIAAGNFNAGDDPRYLDLVTEWGEDFPQRLFWFLQIQAFCAFLLSIAVFLAARNPAPFPTAKDIIGSLLLVRAIAGEAWSDATLTRFRKTRSSGDRVCVNGPWAWSRHPKYFCLWLIWVGFSIIAINFTGIWPQGWLALLAPAFIYWLLVYVSGMPPPEKHMLASRGAEFRAYQERVNAFFLGPQKRI